MKWVLYFVFCSILFSGCIATVPVAPVATLLQCKDYTADSDDIVGGKIVGFGDPDQKLVSMLQIRRPDHESICTASLISDRVLLTAAHCVEGVDASDIFANFKSSAGCPINQLRDMRLKIVKKVIHKNFDGTPKSLSDLALLYLEESAPTDQERLRILEKEKKITNDKILLIGYGITEETKRDSQVLRRIYKSWKNDFTPKGRSLIVDQSSGSGGFCRGDSGAPIIGEVWGEPYIIAVNSANVGIRPQTECQTLSIAISSIEFSDWILRNKKKLESSTALGRFLSSSSERAD